MVCRVSSHRALIIPVGSLNAHCDHRLGLQIHRLLALFGKTDAPIFHLSDFGLGVVRVAPVASIPSFLPRSKLSAARISSTLVNTAFVHRQRQAPTSLAEACYGCHHTFRWSTTLKGTTHRREDLKLTNPACFEKIEKRGHLASRCD